MALSLSLALSLRLAQRALDPAALRVPLLALAVWGLGGAFAALVAGTAAPTHLAALVAAGTAAALLSRVPSHFLEDTHVLPGLEAMVHGHPHDFAALRRLPGRKIVLTNAPRAYAVRVLQAIGAARHFDAVLSIEDMSMFSGLRPKPDARMFKAVAARLKVHPARCVLVEDTLQHQKAAFSVGMPTAWMQRWTRRALRRPSAKPPKVGVYLHRRPAYVCARIFSLRELRRLPL
jgi:FMN phosphatase YigB (HAD superfamily)